MFNPFGQMARKRLNKLSFHNLECWQINLHTCKATSYNISEVIKNECYWLVLAQEPWLNATKIRSYEARTSFKVIKQVIILGQSTCI